MTKRTGVHLSQAAKLSKDWDPPLRNQCLISLNESHWPGQYNSSCAHLAKVACPPRIDLDDVVSAPFELAGETVNITGMVVESQSIIYSLLSGEFYGTMTVLNTLDGVGDVREHLTIGGRFDHMVGDLRIEVAGIFECAGVPTFLRSWGKVKTFYR